MAGLGEKTDGWVKNKGLMGCHLLALILTLIMLQHFSVGFLPVIKCDINSRHSVNEMLKHSSTGVSE